MVNLIYWGSLMDLTNKNGEQIAAATVADVLSHISAQYGQAAFKEAKRMLITVNSTNIQLLSRYKTALNDGDTVAFLPLSAGG